MCTGWFQSGSLSLIAADNTGRSTAMYGVEMCCSLLARNIECTQQFSDLPFMKITLLGDGGALRTDVLCFS